MSILLDLIRIITCQFHAAPEPDFLSCFQWLDRRETAAPRASGNFFRAESASGAAD